MPGSSWSQLVNHQYLTSQGIYGVAVGVVATYVFHFVLFGVLATRIGLGQLFLDVASSVAGRYAGGPAKVSVFGSAMFGMLSGSSVANAVTVGSLTIPAMIRVGYKREFAAAVEAASSTGGQITPPVLGAAAFLMIEFLALPYGTIIAAAAVPAFMHFFGVFMQVHFEAKRHGLRGLTDDEMPRLLESLQDRWPTLIPLALLIAILVSGRTPYLAAFAGISSCAIVGLTTRAEGTTGAAWGLMVGAARGAGRAAVRRDRRRDHPAGDLPCGRRSHTAPAEGARCAGAHRHGRLDRELLDRSQVRAGGGRRGRDGRHRHRRGHAHRRRLQAQHDHHGSAAAGGAGSMSFFVPEVLISTASLTLLVALVMTGIVCILLGCGIPTTANYIIMVTVAAPTLVLLGVEPLVAHFFVFYYGVLADITPPVALAAYAASGMAGSDPFKTGNMAFRLGMAKALVPFVFVFSPSLLLVAKGFTWPAFIVTFTGCVLGITVLAAALSRFLLVEMRRWEQAVLGMAALLLVIPGLVPTLIGAAVAVPVLMRQVSAWRRVQVVPRS